MIRPGKDTGEAAAGQTSDRSRSSILRKMRKEHSLEDATFTEVDQTISWSSGTLGTTRDHGKPQTPPFLA
jgi:hypothetical protein